MQVDLWPSLLLAVVMLLLPAVAARTSGRVATRDVLQGLHGHDALTAPGRRFRYTLVGISIVGVGLLALGVAGGLIAFIFAGAMITTVAAAMILRLRLADEKSHFARQSLRVRLASRFASLYPVRSASVAGVIGSLLVILGLLLTSYGGMSAQAVRDYVPHTPDGSLFLYAEARISPATTAAVQAELGETELVEMGLALGPRPPQPPGEEPYTSWGAVEVSSPFSRCLEGEGPEPSAGRSPEGCSAQTGFPELYQSPSLHTIDAAGLATVIGRTLTAAEQRRFEQGAVMLTDARLATSGRVRLHIPRDDTEVTGTFPAVVLQPRSPFTNMPNAFISAEGLAQIGGEVAPHQSAWFVPKPDEPITDDQETRIRSIVSAEIGSGSYLMDIERGSPAVSIMRRMLASGVIAMTLIASGLAFLIIGLAGREMRPEMTALASAGADRPTRAKVAGLHAVHVVGLGFALALAVLAIVFPVTVYAMRLPPSVWPFAGLACAAAASLTAALIAGRAMGAQVGEIARNELDA